MGFIEEERKQRANEIEAQREVELRREEERRQSEIRIKAENVEKDRRGQLREKAKRRFHQSGVGTLITELGELGKYESFYAFDNNTAAESYACEIVISRKEWPSPFISYETVAEVKSIGIETTADGIIKFKGGLFGSTTVKQSAWEKNRATLEQALEKAYKHPKIERYSYIPDGDGNHGGGP